MSSACHSAGASCQRPPFEVADVFRLYGEAYRRAHPLPLSHLKVMHAIEVCRTAYLGGHAERCDVCGHEQISYNSCRNRHCPKCQALAKAQWLEARRAELLPVDYFHTVFTIPHELNAIALVNKKVVFDILFRATSQTLQKFAADPRNSLGGKIGFTAILHTWDQKLLDHFHLHCLIPGGALSFDGKRWIPARKGFLFPVRALSKVFRGKFIDYIKKEFTAGKLIFPGQTASLGTEEGFSGLVNQLWKKQWVVYCKESFAGPEKVLDYLGRYTHRVAISNHRITSVANGKVSFTYRDRAHGNVKKNLTLSASEFIRRFLLHVLPKSYMRVRYFGFLTPPSKKRSLALCRQLLGIHPDMPEAPEKTTHELMLELTGTDITVCPCCERGTMRFVRRLQPLYPHGVEGVSTWHMTPDT